MKAIKQQWSFASSSSNATYTTILWEDGSYSCNCPGWRIKKEGKERTCTHLTKVGAGNGATQAAPKQKASPAASLNENPAPSAKFFKPMLAHLMRDQMPGMRLEDIPSHWVAEPKFDGERMLVFIEEYRTVAAFSRLGNNSISKSPIAWIKEVRWPIRSGVLDGEACANGGLCIAATTTAGARSSAGQKWDYVIFDLLALNGDDLKKRPWKERRAALDKSFASFSHPSITKTLYTENAAALWREFVEKLGGEGIMLKDTGSLYVPGWRSPHWLKMPMECDVDVVIAGFTDKPTYGSKCYRTSEGAHTFGYYNPETHQIDVVGQGIVATREEAIKNIGRVVTMRCKGITESGALRSGRLVRWREDKPKEECVRP